MASNIILESYKQSYEKARNILVNKLELMTDSEKIEWMELIEELDLELCPICKEYHTELPEFIEEFGYICSQCKEDL